MVHRRLDALDFLQRYNCTIEAHCCEVYVFEYEKCSVLIAHAKL